MTSEDPRDPKDGELSRRFSELRRVQEEQAPAFADMWHAAARGRSKGAIRWLLVGSGAAILLGAAVAISWTPVASPPARLAQIEWRGHEPLAFLLAPPLDLRAKGLEPETDPYKLHLADVLRAYDTGANR